MALQAAQQKLIKSYVERIERLNEERDGLGEDIAEIIKEAKAKGFSTKAIRRVVAARKKDKGEFVDEESLFEDYLAATSWLDTPLGGTQSVAVQEAEYV